MEGAANQALIDFVAGQFAVPKAQVRIVRGESGRKKQVCVDGVSVAEAARVLHDWMQGDRYEQKI